MKRFALFTLCILALTQMMEAQVIETDPVLKAEMSKLDFMEGSWKGKGWMYGADGQRNEFDQTESIQFKLDHTLLLIEGKGVAQGQVMHHALAVVTYDKERSEYDFSSWLASGLSGKYTAKLVGDKFLWYPNEFSRYTLIINEEGQWHEIGEMKRGEQWVQFFEMTLDRQ